MCQVATARPDRKTLNQGQNWITQPKRLAIYMRDGFGCCYCGRGIEQAGVVLTLEHIVPYSKGGAMLDPKNLITACRNCNSARGNKALTVFVRENAAKWGRDEKCVLNYIRRNRARAIDTKTSNALIKQRGTCRKVLDVVVQGEPI